MEDEIQALVNAFRRRQSEQAGLFEEVLIAMQETSRQQDQFMIRLQQIIAAYDGQPETMAQRFAPQGSYVPPAQEDPYSGHHTFTSQQPPGQFTNVNQVPPGFWPHSN